MRNIKNISCHKLKPIAYIYQLIGQPVKEITFFYSSKSPDYFTVEEEGYPTTWGYLIVLQRYGERSCSVWIIPRFFIHSFSLCRNRLQ
jgi:hypothetical protein